MAVGLRSVTAVLGAVALVVSTVGGVGVVGGTNVTPIDGGSGAAVYPGQTVEVVNVSVASGDEVVYSGGINEGEQLSSFEGFPNYGHIEDGTSSSSLEDGDDLLNINGVNNFAESKEVSLTTFNKSTIFLDDASVNGGTKGKYEIGDDIYRVEELSGKAYLSDDGVDYSTFPSGWGYLRPPATSVKGFNGGYPILTDSKIEEPLDVKHDGSVGLFSTIPSQFEHHQDGRGGPYYDSSPEGFPGEAVYDSGGDSQVNVGDTRIYEVIVNSGFGDSNTKTTDLNYDEKSQLSSQELDYGRRADEFAEFLSVNEIDPDGAQNSAVGEFGSEDTIVVDVGMDGYYDENDDIVVKGDPKNGEPYTSSNVGGEWEYGQDDLSNDLIVFDKNNDNNPSGDFVIMEGSVQFSTQVQYSGTIAPLKYLDSDNNGIWNASADSTYFDVGDDGSSTNGALDEQDFRLTGFIVRYPESSEVQQGDYDIGLQLSQFTQQEKYIDSNSDRSYTDNEPIIQSDDEYLDSGDLVSLSGGLGERYQKFSTGGSRIELYYGASKYFDGSPIVSIHNEFPSSSESYHSDVISPGTTISLQTLSPQGTDIISYYGTDQFEDGDSVLKLHRYSETSGNYYQLGYKSEIVLHTISQSLKFPRSPSGYIDGSAVIQEEDTSNQTSLYGDSIQALTVASTGSLDPGYVESVALRRNGAVIATARTRTDGRWVLRPESGTGTIGTVASPTTVSVTAELAADAPPGETLSMAVEPVTDRGSAGVFDAGDAGLFFADDDPVGDVSAGPTYTVADPADITAEAVAYPDPGAGRAVVELAFTDRIDPATTEPGDFAVETANGTVAPAGIRDDDGDRRVVLAMSEDVAPAGVTSVALTGGAVAVTSGAAVPEQTIAVAGTSVVVSENETRSSIVFAGERVTLLADEGGNRDERVRVDAAAGEDAEPTDLVRLASTGSGSLTSVIDTGSRTASRYRATFRSEDGSPGETVTFPVRNLSLVVSAPLANTTDVAGPVEAVVRSAGGRRAMVATLENATSGEVLARERVVTNGSGDATVGFAPVLGNVSIAVTDLGTGLANRTGRIHVREGHPGASFRSQTYVQERGDVVQLGLRLVDTENATVTVGEPSVGFEARIPVNDGDGDGVVNLTINTHRAGRGEAGAGIGLGKPQVRQDGPTDEVGAVERIVPRTKGLGGPLDAARYELRASVNGTPTDLATLRLRGRSTNGAETLVAPAAATLDSASAIANVSTPRATVAVGDQAIVAVNASGLAGFLNDTTDLGRHSRAAARTGAFVTIAERNPPPNAPPRHLNVSRAETFLHEATDTLYLVLPSRSHGRAVRAGDEFATSFVLNETSPYVPGASTPDVVETEETTTSVAFEAPTGRFTDATANATLDLPNVSSVTVAGSTNVAPGTVVTVTVESADESATFVQQDEDTVDDDGSFDAEVDLSSYPTGTDYTVVATANDEPLTPVLTGSIEEAAVTTNASMNHTVAVAGGAGGGGSDRDVDDRTATTERTTTAGPMPTERPTTRSPLPEPVRRYVPEPVLRFVATRATTIVFGLGAVAVVVALWGVRRL